MNNKIKLVTVGGDFEVFLRDKETKEVVSSEGYIQGSKRNPFCFDDADKHFSTQLDNVLTEFTIAPVKNKSSWIHHINYAMNYVKSVIPTNLEIYVYPAASLNEKYLQTKQAKTFGCSSDFNAYTMEVNPKPMSSDWTLRSSGGHIHIGFDEMEVPFDGKLYRYMPDEQRCNIVKVMDLFLSIPAVLLEPDNKRKQLYGKAGAFRPTPYGLEYRTISNFYLANNKLKGWAFDSVKAAFRFINENGFLNNQTASLVEETINDNDKQTAEALIKEYKLQLV